MAFVLQQSPTYKWTVRILIPTDGKREQFTFTAVFNRLKQSRLKELKAISDDPSLAAESSDVDVLMEVMADWEDVKDDQGKPVAFSRLAVEQIAELPGVGGQIVEQFLSSFTEAKRKN
jgi:hypothetical protein